MIAPHRLFCFYLIAFCALSRAEERPFTNEIEYLPDAAATEAARKGERQARRIQQRRKERGTAGRIAVDSEQRIATGGKNPPSLIAQARDEARSERHANRSRFLQAILEAVTPRVGVDLLLKNRSVKLDLVLAFGTSKADDSEDDWDDWNDWDDALAEREREERRMERNAKSKYKDGNTPNRLRLRPERDR